LESIDDLTNKIIRSNGDLLVLQVSLAVDDMKKNIIEKLEILEEKIKNRKSEIIQFEIEEVINNSLLTNKLKGFFVSSQTSQILEETNPLAEVTHKRKISSFGIGGTEKKSNNLSIREIHPNHYARICPIETSEGKNAGLILTFAKETRINKLGFVESPFYV
jgi:DNA-directed RNA polymerase subunit beta